jgi:hypothetical protein
MGHHLDLEFGRHLVRLRITQKLSDLVDKLGVNPLLLLLVGACYHVLVYVYHACFFVFIFVVDLDWLTEEGLKFQFLLFLLLLLILLHLLFLFS